jgi:RNA polymerase sigma-70 factor (ECF subfamily)
LSSKPEHSIRIEDLGRYAQAKEVLLSASEQELVAACQAGKREAQKRVYELFSGKMLSICRRYAKSDAQAQDLMHDGFIKVFLSINKFKGHSALQTWITRIMINNSISTLRKEVRKGIKVQLDQVQLPAAAAKDFDFIEHKGISAQQVFDCITQLPIGYRTVFSLYVLDGYTHKEIAENLGVTEGTSKSQLAKAKKMLYKLLTQA